jgi:hypothetical protein
MRTLAELACPTCGRRFYGDLPTGHGLPFAALLHPESGEVHHAGGLEIFAEHLARSYRERSATPLDLRIEEIRPLRRPLFLNCLDWVYGHSLLKLLNAQYHLDHQPGFDLVLLIPRFLRWLVPDGVAEIWTVDVPLSKGWIWSDWLAETIATRMAAHPDWWLSPALPHPMPADYSIERFTRVVPFPLAEWEERAAGRSTVTYVWRGDRDWAPAPRSSATARLRARLERRLRLDVSRRTARIVSFAERLRLELGRLDFAVVGLDRSGTFPAWIEDLRDDRPSAEVERGWCERFASSHLVCGVHGSNMLLPSAHAGGVLEFVPDAPWDSRWGNIVQDVLIRGTDPRDVLFRYRFLPADVEPVTAARVAASMLRDRRANWMLFDPDRFDHDRIGATWKTLPQLFRKAGPRPPDTLPAGGGATRGEVA